jgi:two-component system sensor histidine kinase KdpD
MGSRRAVAARHQPQHPHSTRDRVVAIGAPILSVAAISAVGIGLYELVALQNISMLYLAAVVVSAILGGRLSAILAAGLSFLAYNFFFIQPTWTFSVARPYEVFALFIFVGVALVTGTLAARLREHAAAARQQALSTQALFDFSRKLSGALGLDAVFATTAAHIHASLGRGTVVFASDESGSEPNMQVALPPELALDNLELSAVRTALDKKQRTGFMTGTLPHVPYLFLPIMSGHRAVGVVGLMLANQMPALASEEERMLAAFLEQAAIAIDRARLARENARAAVARESEKLQSALLSSLSHDLRTPLASITGAVTSLRELGDKMDQTTRADLLASIEEEADRLNRFVANLFDMTRIESGALKVKREAITIPEVVERALSRAERVYPDFRVDLSFSTDLPSARGDPVLLEQALFNILDNARKYGGPDKPVAIFVRADDGDVTISITDHGKGIPADDLERIFDKFYRRSKRDGRAPGTGLGLSIARGFVVGMGGSIQAESPAARRRGTRFLIRLPTMRDEAVP